MQKTKTPFCINAKNLFFPWCAYWVCATVSIGVTSFATVHIGFVYCKYSDLCTKMYHCLQIVPPQLLHTSHSLACLCTHGSDVFCNHDQSFSLQGETYDFKMQLHQCSLLLIPMILVLHSTSASIPFLRQKCHWQDRLVMTSKDLCRSIAKHNCLIRQLRIKSF